MVDVFAALCPEAAFKNLQEDKCSDPGDHGQDEAVLMDIGCDLAIFETEIPLSTPLSTNAGPRGPQLGPTDSAL